MLAVSTSRELIAFFVPPITGAYRARAANTTREAHSLEAYRCREEREVLDSCNRARYIVTVIRSFGDGATQDLASGKNTARVRRIPVELRRSVLRKLQLIHRAMNLNDLRVPPGNRLEALSGDLAGYHSIRINDQWRVIFRWVDGDAFAVSIKDYH
jgi:proteic killer suppression protein